MTVPAELILQPSELGQLLTDTEYNCVNTGSSWSMYFIYAKPQLWLPPTKGGWKRSYSIYYIHTRRRSEAQQRWSRLNSFLSYWQKYSPLKFLFHFSHFFPPPVLQHQASWEEGGGERRTLWQSSMFLFLTSLQGFPTSHLSASLQLFCFLLNPMAHQGADTECKKQFNRKHALLRSPYHTHFLLCTNYDGSAQRLSLWRAYRWAKAMSLSRWKSSF